MGGHRLGELAITELDNNEDLSGEVSQLQPGVGSETFAIGIGHVLVEFTDPGDTTEEEDDEAEDVDPMDWRDPQEVLEVEGIKLTNKSGEKESNDSKVVPPVFQGPPLKFCPGMRGELLDGPTKFSLVCGDIFDPSPRVLLWRRGG